MNAGGRGHQEIDERAAPNRGQPSPLFRDRAVDGQNPVGVIGQKPRKPVLERRRPPCISSSDLFDTSTDFADDDDTEAKVLVIDGGDPCCNPRVTGRPLPKLGDDVGIDEVGQIRTARAGRRTRAKSRSVPTLGIDNSASLNVWRLRRGRSVVTRISRCSASTDRPWRAARMRSAATTPGSRLRTMSWAFFVAIVLSTIA